MCRRCGHLIVEVEVLDDYQISADAELPPVALFDAYSKRAFRVSDRRAGEGSPSHNSQSAIVLRSAPPPLLLARVFFFFCFSLLLFFVRTSTFSDPIRGGGDLRRAGDRIRPTATARALSRSWVAVRPSRERERERGGKGRGGQSVSPPSATQQLTGDTTVHGAKLQTGRIMLALTVRLECGAAGLLPPGNLHLHLVHHAWQLACDN